jgi:anti-sigma-K factor RskA
MRVPPVVTPPPTPAEERAAMLSQPDALKVTLGATQDPAATGASGDVVWDPITQRGFIRFVGLKPNDPRLHQYQLWIFDGERDPRYPVDGGVFDVPADSAEVVVPIRAALRVHDPKAFAVTIEKPGGAVVSDRGHVVALGKAS